MLKSEQKVFFLHTIFRAETPKKKKKVSCYNNSILKWYYNSKMKYIFQTFGHWIASFVFFQLASLLVVQSPPLE